MVGGATKADINDPTVKSALNFAVKMYNGQVNYMFSRKPVIDNEASVTKQVILKQRVKKIKYNYCIVNKT